MHCHPNGGPGYPIQESGSARQLRRESAALQSGPLPRWRESLFPCLDTLPRIHRGICRTRGIVVKRQSIGWLKSVFEAA